MGGGPSGGGGGGGGGGGRGAGRAPARRPAPGGPPVGGRCLGPPRGAGCPSRGAGVVAVVVNVRCAAVARAPALDGRCLAGGRGGRGRGGRPLRGRGSRPPPPR